MSKLEVRSRPYTLFSQVARRTSDMYSIIFKKSDVLLLFVIKNDIAGVETMQRRARK